jgi:hypothetical protein
MSFMLFQIAGKRLRFIRYVVHSLRYCSCIFLSEDGRVNLDFSFSFGSVIFSYIN